MYKHIFLITLASVLFATLVTAAPVGSHDGNGNNAHVGNSDQGSYNGKHECADPWPRIASASGTVVTITEIITVITIMEAVTGCYNFGGNNNESSDSNYMYKRSNSADMYMH
ncbi:9501_t:CDS:2 [Ambispora leptoticha]|uniref:9501_t:CDS:1 n=1 Tax=Ambispora leptoticha TaxID=144679 RepID=A0A9N9AEW9_9GLOM|nr:9501_t:CDS:2 [Ambispora leptoticha]